MYKIAISDLDGTLLGADHRVSVKTKESIRRWLDSGKKFVIATGRHYIEANHLQQELNIPIYLITSNGARVHDRAGQIILRQDLPSEIVEGICNSEFDSSVQVNLFTDQNWFTNFRIPELEDMGLDAGFDCIEADFSTLEKNNIIKIFFWAEHEKLSIIYELLRSRHGDKINLTFSLDKCLEVMHEDTNKGEGVLAVLKEKGLDVSDAIAFGDGMNDLEMLQTVAKPVLMANAQHALRSALPNAEITLSSKEDGVAVMLDKYLNTRNNQD
jgi:Cof subfamily protein (haloacid dehalogenase superfamily)